MMVYSQRMTRDMSYVVVRIAVDIVGVTGADRRRQRRRAVEQDGKGARTGLDRNCRQRAVAEFLIRQCRDTVRGVERPYQQPRRGALAFAPVRREANARHRPLGALVVDQDAERRRSDFAVLEPLDKRIFYFPI